MIKRNIDIREAEIKDTAKLLSWSNDKDYWCTYIHSSQQSNEENFEKLKNRIIAMQKENAKNKLFIISSEKHKYIGVVHFYHIDWKNHNLFVETHIDRTFQGSPVITMMLNKAMNMAFDKYNMHKVLYSVHSNNKKMLKIQDQHENIPVVTLKNHYYENGIYKDVFVYEWFKNTRTEDSKFDNGFKKLLKICLPEHKARISTIYEKYKRQGTSSVAVREFIRNMERFYDKNGYLPYCDGKYSPEDLLN